MIPDLYGRFADVSDDPDVITDKVLDSLMGMRKADLREQIRPVVLNVIIDLRRERVLRIERAVACESSGAPEVDAASNRKDLLHQSFYSPARHEYVLWGRATAEDHLSYAEMQRKNAAGLIATAKLHELKAQEIQAAGVTCLFDLGAKS